MPAGRGKTSARAGLATRDPQGDTQKRRGHCLSVAGIQQTAGIPPRGIENCTRKGEFTP